MLQINTNKKWRGRVSLHPTLRSKISWNFSRGQLICEARLGLAISSIKFWHLAHQCGSKCHFMKPSTPKHHNMPIFWDPIFFNHCIFAVVGNLIHDYINTLSTKFGQICPSYTSLQFFPPSTTFSNQFHVCFFSDSLSLIGSQYRDIYWSKGRISVASSLKKTLSPTSH